MNSYEFTGQAATAPTKDDLRALAFLFLFGDEYSAFQTANKGTGLRFELPFSLSNLSTVQVSELVYDTQAQEVNEYSDKPYPVKGYLCVCYEKPAFLGTTAPDMDNFIRLPYYDSALLTNNYIYIGICNASQTQFYTPFSGFAASEKVFFAIPKDAYVSAQASLLGQSGIIPTFAP